MTLFAKITFYTAGGGYEGLYTFPVLVSVRTQPDADHWFAFEEGQEIDLSSIVDPEEDINNFNPEEPEIYWGDEYSELKRMFS